MIGIDLKRIQKGCILYGYKFYIDSDYNSILKQENKIIKNTKTTLYLENKDLECFEYKNKIKLANLNTIEEKDFPSELVYITESSISEITVLNILKERANIILNEKLDYYKKVVNNLDNIVINFNVNERYI